MAAVELFTIYNVRIIHIFSFGQIEIIMFMLTPYINTQYEEHRKFVTHLATV